MNVHDSDAPRCFRCGEHLPYGKGRCPACGAGVKAEKDDPGRSIRKARSARARPPSSPHGRSRFYRVFLPIVILSLLAPAVWQIALKDAVILSGEPSATRELAGVGSSGTHAALGSIGFAENAVAVPAGVQGSTELALPQEAVDPGRINAEALSLNRDGVRLFKEGDPEAALEKLEGAHFREPNDPVIARNFSNVLTYLGWSSVKQEEYDLALRHFDRALGVNEDNVDAWKGSGYARIQLKETEAAIRDFEEAHRLAPGDPDVALSLARLLYQADHLGRAKEVLGALLTEKPRHAKAKKLLARMRQDESVERRFQANDTGHFRLKFDATANAHVGALVSAILEEAYSTVGSDFRYFPSDPVVVSLYTKEEFRSVSGSPHWSRGVYDGKIRIPVGGLNQRSEELEDVVYHEYTHVVVTQIARGRCPTWLNEGLAQYAEPSEDGGKRAMLRLLREHDLVPFSSLEGSFLKLSGESARLAYAQAYAAVLYIAENYSFYHLRNILEEIGSGSSPEEAVKKVLHFGYPDLQTGISGYLRRSG